MSLRKKACAACVASKRKCDQSQPACHRCAKLHLSCQYPSSSSGVILEPHIGISDDSVLPFDGTSVSHSTFENLVWDSSWDIRSLGLDFTIAPHTIKRPASHLDTEDLKDLGERAAQSTNLSNQLQPAYEENATAAQTFLPQDKQPTALSRHDTCGGGKFCPSFCQRTGLQQKQLVLADFSFVPMYHDANRWTFCASRMVSYVAAFAKTASTDFIAPNNLQPPLAAAIGVCAAHETLTGPSRVVLDKLIETEIENLIWYAPQRTTLSLNDLSTFGNINDFTPTDELQLFREELARVQAMTLYHIMRSFGSNIAQRRQAAQQEPLLAAWTTALQERIHKLYCAMDQNISSQAVSSFLPLPRPDQSSWMPTNGRSQHDNYGFNTGPLREDELETAHRTVLISYFVRATYTVVTYGVCPLISELESLMVSVPASVRGWKHGLGSGHMFPSHVYPPFGLRASNASRLSYKELLGLWEEGFMSTSDLEDEYTQLLLVACKGVDVLSRDMNSS
jgi:primosomal protein N''